MKKSLIIFIAINSSILPTKACEPAPPPVYKVQGDAVYFHEHSWDDRERPLLVSQNVKNFKTINELYAKDSTEVFYRGNVLQGADPDTFEFLGGVEGLVTKDGYSKDTRHVYFLGKPITGGDPVSFELFENAEAFARDKHHIYSKSEILEQFNVATTKSLGNGYWSEGHMLYYYSNDKSNLNKPVLTLLSNEFNGKYKQFDDYFLSTEAVFRNGKKTSFDPASFQVLASKDVGNSCFPKVIAILISDKNGTWIEDEKLQIHLRLMNEYTNVFESKSHELYVFTRDDGLKNIGLKSQLNLLKLDDVTLIQGGKNSYLLDHYRLQNLSEILPEYSKLSIYASLGGLLILTDDMKLYIFDGSLYSISDGMPRLIFINDDTAVFEDKNGEILNINNGGLRVSNPRDNSSSLFDESGMNYIRYSNFLAELMKSKNIKLEPNQGMFLIKKNITFADASSAITINAIQYEKLIKYAVSDTEWEKIRKENVRFYLSKSKHKK